MLNVVFDDRFKAAELAKLKPKDWLHKELLLLMQAAAMNQHLDGQGLFIRSWPWFGLEKIVSAGMEKPAP